MREVDLSDIWDYFQKCWIVVPTNIGYKAKPPLDDPALPCGENVMGAGMARVAAEKVPHLPLLYGLHCHYHGANTPVYWHPQSALIMFPTKPMAKNPAMSWKSKSTVELIERSTEQLAALDLPSKGELLEMGLSNPAQLRTDDVLVPLVGCGNGGLKEDDVVPILRKHLTSERFVLVRHRPF